MARMEFLDQNEANTTTMITVNTGTSERLIDRKDTTFTASFSTSTAATLTIDIDFGETVQVDRIALQECNWKNFKLLDYTGGVSVAVLSLTADTEGQSQASYTTNSATSLYFNVNNSLDQIRVIVNSTTSGSSTKQIEQIWISELLYQLELNPAPGKYSSSKERQEYLHELADGGHVQYLLGDYFEGNMTFEYVSLSQRNSLRTVYDNKKPVVFVPYPTSTSWNSEIYETIWTGKFEFIQRSHSTEDQGFSGRIKLLETGR